MASQMTGPSENAAPTASDAVRSASLYDNEGGAPRVAPLCGGPPPLAQTRASIDIPTAVPATPSRSLALPPPVPSQPRPAPREWSAQRTDHATRPLLPHVNAPPSSLGSATLPSRRPVIRPHVHAAPPWFPLRVPFQRPLVEDLRPLHPAAGPPDAICGGARGETAALIDVRAGQTWRRLLHIGRCRRLCGRSIQVELQPTYRRAAAVPGSARRKNRTK
eukprot:5506672-Prymnesium_polylepis.1